MSVTKKKEEYVKIEVTLQDSLVEKEVAFSSIKILQACSLKKHYDSEETNLLVIDEKEPFKIPYKKTPLYDVQQESGVFMVYKDEKKICLLPTMENFESDLSELLAIAGDPAVKTLSHKRLNFLRYKYNFHLTLNGAEESKILKTRCKKDFYHVEKVDQNVGYDSFFSATSLLEFIKQKYEDCSNEIVHKDGDGNELSLADILFEHTNNPEDLSVDFLNVFVDHTLFHRQDKFNEHKQSMGGSTALKKLFLSFDNHQKGLYFAELAKEVLETRTLNRTCSEISVVLFGEDSLDWKKISDWVVNHKIYSPNARWMINIPRSYCFYKKKGVVNSFGDFLSVIFKPLFDVTLDPSSDPKLASYLLHCVSFGIASMESSFKVDENKNVSPADWTSETEPDYDYYSYYIFANLKNLNTLRIQRSLNPLKFKPTSGGNVRLHLATSFLLCSSIHNGILLAHSPALEYLYYLTQIGISMSPLHTNKLLLQYTENPFPLFFREGMNVTLCTSSPLHFHYTEEQLLEEYSVAAQIWKLSRCDMCEISKNSILQSGYEHFKKQSWLGDTYDDKLDELECNIPSVRSNYRKDTLDYEKDFLLFCAKQAKNFRNK
eukprot:gene12344-6016_t